jgi:hypothetical protein
VHRSTADTIAFFAPGLVHQFGNLLLTIQGHALNLGAAEDQLERSRDAILGASDRGVVTLRLLRHLLGEPTSAPVDAFALGEQLAELARVPVREAHQLLEWQRPKAAPSRCLVEVGDFVPLVAETLRSLVSQVPHGVQGTISVALAPAASDVHVLIRFRPEAGSLPFPLALDRLAAEVAATGRRSGWRGQCRAIGHSLECTIPRLTNWRSEPSDGLHGSFSTPT